MDPSGTKPEPRAQRRGVETYPFGVREGRWDFGEIKLAHRVHLRKSLGVIIL